MRSIVRTLIASAVLLAPTAAHALPSARLVYLREPGTESCPAETEVRDAVQRRLGYGDGTLLVRYIHPTYEAGYFRRVGAAGTPGGCPR